MKNVLKAFGVIALVAIIGFSMAACGGGGDDDDGGNTATYTGTSDGTTYTLKITNTARYAAQNGDAYVLTGGTKSSAGTVSNVSGNTLTLTPTNAPNTPFTATVSGSNITGFSGNVTWVGESTPTPLPGTLTGGSTPGTNPGTGTGGTLTVTDIPAKYNGKYVYFGASGKDINGEDIGVVGLQSVGGAGGTSAFANSTFARISNGRVSIPIWLSSTADKTLVRYSGNDSFDGIITFNITEVDTLGKVNAQSYLVMSVFSSVTFTNGSATLSRNNATRWTEYVNGTPQN
jgi:hypothetical protein